MRTSLLVLLPLAALVACNNPDKTDADGDGFVTSEDCDDNDAAIHPDAEEVCDGVDNNCDELVDEDVQTAFYGDGDGDGFGAGEATLACEAPADHVAQDGDCDDADAAINPDANEVCDLADNNCDGGVDEGVTLTLYRDQDADGYGVDTDTVQACEVVNGYATEGGDCDDARAEAYPGAPEACDETDANCDGDIDNDADGDGFSDQACGGLDCDDNDITNYDQCTPGLDAGFPALNCLDILASDPSVASGVYWLDGNGGDPSDAYQAYCDMETDGGGWIVTYLVDGEHFDAEYANNVTESDAAPTALNSQSDIWNAEKDFAVNELLYACTTQGGASSHYWTYTDTAPHSWFTDTIGGYEYQTINSTGTDSTPATCMSTHNSSSYGFIVIEADSCGSCNTMLYGMYHYPGRTGCNSTDTTYGSHASPWDGRSIDYPICAGQQTTDGSFWMGVR